MTTPSLEPWKFDTRIAQRLILVGEITQEEYDAHLKSLPDLEETAASIEARQDGTDDASEEDEG